MNCVKLYNVAVSDYEGMAELLIYNSFGTTTSHLAYENEDLEKVPVKFDVKTVTLDSLVEKGEIQPPSLIKIDIEGHGDKALMGSKEILSVYSPVIIMSFHSPIEVANSTKLLKSIGCKPFSCEGENINWPSNSFCGTVLFRII